jgi:hypothetical protein
MHLRRIVVMLAALLTVAGVARADFLSWLFNHDLEVIVDTDILPAGAQLPPASREHPVYYVGVSLGYQDLGGYIAGDKLPKPETMYAWIAKALAKQGYLPANSEHPPTQLVVFSWGSLYTSKFTGNPDFPPVQMNRGAMLRFIGGQKLGLIAKSPAEAQFELGPDLRHLRPDAERFVTAASDDLYMAALLGYDFQSAAQKQRRLLWRTRIACPARGFVMADTLPTMISIATPMIARETKVPEWIRASDHYQPSITIGDPKVEKYLESGPLPIYDSRNSKKADTVPSK